MRRLIWNGDAVAATGFAKVTHHILDVLRHTWEVHVVGINFHGDLSMADRERYPYPIYPADLGGDSWGIGRLEEKIPEIKPDLVVIQNDPWNVVEYAKVLRPFNVPVAAYMPVDGQNVKNARQLTGLDMAIFYTEFGLNEARACGYQGPGEVVPLGVDLTTYYPQDRADVRKALGFGKKNLPDDIFVVGNVNRNQPRKRIDLTIAYFAEWVSSHDIKNAYLHLHMAPTGDRGWNLAQLCRYYGIEDRLIITSEDMDIGIGVDESTLSRIYGAFDVQMTTTQGEGWGLTTMEGMACGIPQIVPDWSALGDWTGAAVIKVPCTEIAVTPAEINVIGGVPDRQAMISALDHLYRHPEAREELSSRGLALVEQGCYRWEAVGEEFGRILDTIPPKPKPAKKEAAEPAVV
jgi:D-inositol-3-phosphate glycosyltransferase